MNDAYRGALIVGSLAALYVAFRLAAGAVLQWKRAARRHVGYHAVLMAVALSVTVGLVIAGAVTDAGDNRPLTWWDAARGVQVVLIVAGLRPLWAHQKQVDARRDREAPPP